MHVRSRQRCARRDVVVQLSLMMLAMVVVVAPPATGSIAIMPAVSADPAATYRWAFAAGARPIAPGPYPGSLVVRGSLRALLRPAIAHGALLLSARVAGCGTTVFEDQ